MISSLAKSIEHDEFLSKSKTGHSNNNKSGSNKDTTAAAPKKDPDAMDLSSARVGGARITRAKRRSASPPPPKLTPQIARRAGIMRIPTKQRAPTPQFFIEKPDGGLDPIDPNDIRFLSAPNFHLLARQKGVQIMRTTIAELEDAAAKAEYEEQPSILLPDLTEGTFKDLLRGRRDTEYWKTVLPEQCHEFVDYVLPFGCVT